MRVLQLIHRQARSESQADRYEGGFTTRGAQNGEKRSMGEFSMSRLFRANRDDNRRPYGTEGFFKDLSADAQSDFASLATHFHCPGSTVLISEAQEPSSILFLLEGEVNISMNSYDGRRLLLGVAGPGDTLGLTSAISGDSSEICAEAMYPCRIASLQRQDFLGFLLRHPSASQNVARRVMSCTTREPARDYGYLALHRPQWRNSPIYCWSGAERVSRQGAVSRSGARLLTGKSASASGYPVKRSPAPWLTLSLMTW